MIVYRTKLRPGETTYVWNRNGGLDPHGWKLKPIKAGGEYIPAGLGIARRSIQPWDWEYHHGMQIPAGIPTGEYHLCRGDDATDVIITIHVPTMSVRTIPKNITKPVRTKENGLYLVNRERRRHWDNSYANHCFTPADNIAIYGLNLNWSELGSDAQWRYVFKDMRTEQGPIHNTTLRRCVFRAGESAGASLGEWDRPGALFVDCLFDGVSAGMVTGPCLFVRCTFRGPTTNGYNAFSTWGARGIGMIDCTFIGTDRGPVLQATRGGISECLFTGTEIRGLDSMPNGCESFGCEGGAGEIADNLFLHTRYSGLSWCFEHWDARTRNNLHRDFTVTSPQGIWLLGDPWEQIDNVFMDGMIDGGGLILGTNTRGTKFANVYRTQPRPGLGNQFSGIPWNVGVNDFGTGNDLSGLGQINVSGNVIFPNVVGTPNPEIVRMAVVRTAQKQAQRQLQKGMVA